MYRVFGRSLASDIPLVLPPSSEPADWMVHGRSEHLDETQWRWYHETRLPDGRLWSRWGRSETPARLLVDFPGFASFVIHSAERRIEVHGSEDLPPHTLQHLLVDQVLPLALSVGGDFVIHASAVERSRAAVAFAGDSGEGKSTLATYLTNSGWRFATDDALRLVPNGHLEAFAGSAVARLWDDSAATLATAALRVPIAHYTSKTGVTARDGEGVPEEPFRLERIYLLGSGPDVVIAEPSPQEAFAALLRSSFRFALDDREALTRELRQIERVVKSGVARRLSYPRDYGRLAEVAAAIESDVRIA